MATLLERRLRQIEERLDTLEEVAGITPVEAALETHERRPIPPPPPLPTASTRRPPLDAPPPLVGARATADALKARRQPADEPAGPPVPTTPVRTEKPPRDWERFFGMAVLGRVGVAAVLLAASYFAKLAYDAMSDELKVASIYLLSAAFFATGWFLRERVATRYVALLWGGAAASAYLAGLAAHLRYGLVGTLGGLAMLFGASVFGQALARRLRHETLACIALAGAFAAPLFVVFPLSERAFPLDPTFLLVYLLALHGWSAWVERAWSWTSARLVGVLGTLVVAGVWIWQAGGVDASTYVYIHLYLLGLVLPELVTAATGRPLAPERQLLVPISIACVETALLLAAGGPIQVHALTGFTALAGGAWLLIALALSFLPAKQTAALLVQGLGRVGGVMLAFGLLHFSPAILGHGSGTDAAWTVVGLTLLCGVLLALRPRLGTGEIGASLAAACAIFATLNQPRDLCLQLLPIALLGAAALVATGREALTRGVGVWLGFVLLLGGLAQAEHYHVAWLAVALMAAALWMTGVMARGRTHAQRELERQGVVGLWLLGIVWTLIAFFGRLRNADLALANPATAAAIVIAAAAAWGALRHRPSTPTRLGHVRPALWLLCAVILLLAGQRETAEAVEGLARPIRAALYVLYLAAASVTLAWIGRWRHLRAPALAGMGLALFAVARALWNGTAPHLGAWAVLELLAPVAAVLAIVHLAPRKNGARDPLLVPAAAWGLGAASVAWCLYALEARLPAQTLLVNARFLAGVLILGAYFLLPARMFRDNARRAAGLALLASAVLLGYLVGLAELLDAVEPLVGRGAWPEILVSVYTTLFAAGLLVAGFVRRSRPVRYAALVGFGAVILKIGLFDLSEAELPLRILVTGVLGLVLLAAAYAYARRSGTRETDVAGEVEDGGEIEDGNDEPPDHAGLPPG